MHFNATYDSEEDEKSLNNEEGDDNARILGFLLRACIKSTAFHHFPSPYAKKTYKFNRKPKY